MKDIDKLSHLFNQINEPIVCVKCSDEFTSGQTDSKSLQDYSKFDVDLQIEDFKFGVGGIM